ncbi:glycosyl hydrolase family 3 N terminal domain-containing protein [Aspergillus germanicus]
MAILSVGAIFGLLMLGGPAKAQVQPLNTTTLGQYGHSEPVYPSQLTLAEKADMVTGVASPCIGNIYPIPRLNFSGICLQDGPLSLRVADYVSVFPSGVTIAASWDKRVMYERNLAMGREFKAKGAHVALAPAAGALGRSVYGGRNWEGFSPDPYLSGVAMELSIKGIQDAGLQAVAKHLIANEQEILRNPVYYPNGTLQFEAISSNVDDRTLHELYLWPFANAVHAGVASVMCSYQRLNGSYACQNSKLLNGILKEELGFQGYVMSDWFGLHAGIDAIKAGMDMDMPGRLRSNITTKVQNNTLDEARLDDMITRIMIPYFHLRQDAENDFPTVDASSDTTIIRDARDNHPSLIRKHAAESTVLLKNTNNALRLDTLASSETMQEALEARAIQDGTLVKTWLNNTLIATSDVTSLWSYGGPDVCLVFLKSWARETIDRERLHLDWDGDQVVESVASRYDNTIVISHSAGANVLPFADHPNVTAILFAHYPGQETGNSIMDVLYGDVNPSGKLPYTIAYNESDYNAPIIDYRYFDAHDIPVRYEFGYGLSYTTFDMSNIEIEPASSSPITSFHSSRSSSGESSVSPPGGHLDLWQTLYTVRISVTNTGLVRGSAVPQLYIAFPGAEGSASTSGTSALSGTPPCQLRGFEKIELAPGEQLNVSFGVMHRDISYWDVVIPEGEFVLRAGFSSRDLVLEERVTPISG